MIKLPKKVNRIIYEYGIVIFFLMIAIVIIIKSIDLPYIFNYNTLTKLLFYNYKYEKEGEYYYTILILFNNFSVSYIAACFFYFIQTIHIRKEKDIYLRNPDIQCSLKQIYADFVDILNFDSEESNNLQILTRRFDEKESLSFLIKNFDCLLIQKTKEIENIIQRISNNNCPNELRYLFNSLKKDEGYIACIGLSNCFKNDSISGYIDIKKTISIIDKYIIEKFSYHSFYKKCYLDLEKDIYKNYFLLSLVRNGIKNNKLSLINVETHGVNLDGDKIQWFRLIPYCKDGYYQLEHNNCFVKILNYSNDKEILSFVQDKTDSYIVKDEKGYYLSIDNNKHFSLASNIENAIGIYCLSPNEDNIATNDDI